MSRLLSATRYLIIVPILGLLLAAGLFFVLGGIALVRQLLEVLGGFFGIVNHAGIGLPIAALGLFVGLRAWSVKLGRETAAEAEDLPQAGAGWEPSPRETEERPSGGE